MMAQFYGTIQGQRGEATRLGSKASGIKTTAETWTRKVHVEIRYVDGIETALIWVTDKQGWFITRLYAGPLDTIGQDSGVS